MVLSCHVPSVFADGTFVSVSAGSSAYSDGTRSFSLMGGLLPVIAEGRASAGLALRYTRWARSARIDIGESRSIDVQGFDVGALNLAVLAEYLLTSEMAVGFNIDLIGISHGSDTTLTGAVNTSANPTASNLLLGGKNDRGSLNSEFYGAYSIGPIRLASGLSHQVIELTAQQTSTEKLQRFFDVFFVRADYFF